MKQPQSFTYYGVRVLAMGSNSIGLRYKTSLQNDIPLMRTETKQQMKEYIKKNIVRHK